MIQYQLPTLTFHNHPSNRCDGMPETLPSAPQKNMFVLTCDVDVNLCVLSKSVLFVVHAHRWTDKERDRQMWLLWTVLLSSSDPRSHRKQQQWEITESTHELTRSTTYRSTHTVAVSITVMMRTTESLFKTPTNWGQSHFCGFSLTIIMCFSTHRWRRG